MNRHTTKQFITNQIKEILNSIRFGKENITMEDIQAVYNAFNTVTIRLPEEVILIKQPSPLSWGKKKICAYSCVLKV